MTPPAHPLPRFVRAPGVFTRSAPDCILVLTPALDLPVALHGTGVAVWDSFSAPRSVPEAAGALAEAFRADRDEIEPQVASVVHALVKSGALVEVAS